MIMKKLAKNHCIFVQISHFSIQNHRFCCSRCIDEPQNVAKSFIFIENSLKNSLFFEQKIMFSRMLVCRWSPQKSLVFHSKCERFMQNPRFHRSTYVDETKNAAKSFIFIGNSLKIRLLQKRVGRQSLQTRCPNRDKSSILAPSFSRRLGRQSLQTGCPNRDTSSILAPFFSRRLGRQKLLNTMPKSRQIVESYILLFTTSRSTEGPKHDAQIATTVDRS